MSHVIDVTDATFMAEVMERSRRVPVLVDFWADWCQPCKALGPVLVRLAEEYGGQFVLARADTEQTQQVAAALRVQSIPAVFLFRDGQPVDAFVGAQPEEDIRRFLAPHVTTEADRLAEAGDRLERGGSENAEEAFRRALESDPKQPAAHIGLARVLLRRGEIDGAREHADAIPPEAAEVRAAERLLEALDFWSLGLPGAEVETPEEPDAALDARLMDAVAAARDGAFEPALTALYEVLGENREYRNQMARRAMVSIFGFLGEDSDATRTWQRRLASLLY